MLSLEMLLQVRLDRESCTALAAGEGLGLCVDPFVIPQGLLGSKSSATDVTEERLF